MTRNTAVFLSLLVLFVFFPLGRVVTASRSGTLYPTPAPFPEYPTATARAIRPQESDSSIAESARQQIQALLIEKESRSSVQQKIDSQLLYAIRMRRGGSIAGSVQTLAVDVGADDAGLVTVDITALVDEQLLRDLAGMGLEVSNVFPQYHSLRAVASLEQLETIAGFAQVRFIQPRQEAMFSQAAPQTSDTQTGYGDFNARAARVRGQIQQALTAAPPSDNPLAIGSVTSQGDTTHKAFAARGTFNTDGMGVKIGVLSDGVFSLATSQASGDLGTVTILPGQGGSGNEGTAMLEIIHDLAPAAQLYFATAGNGLTSFAQNIRDLRAAGCDIIIDDVGYFVESPFQDGQASSIISTNNAGVATQAVNDVVASGALYFSAAANSGNKNDGTSGTWEGDFADGGTLSLVPGGNVHDFDPTAGVLQYDTITASGSIINLHWSDALGASGNDYDLFVLNSTGTAVLASSTNIQSGTQDPYEQVTSGVDITNNRIVVLQKTGAANRFLHLSTNRGRLSVSTEGDTHGHNAASGGYGVAAVCAVCVFPSVFDSSNTIETFSSNGPRRIFFNGNGSAITPGNVSSTGGSVLQKPDITAADGVAVSGAGGFPTLFSGTSAAAPHAAAIAALLKSANPALTQSQIRTALTSTAIDIEGPGTDRDSGAGIVMPYAALQSLGPPVAGKAFLELSTVSKSETCCNGDGFIDPGESGALNISLNNRGLLDATSATATLTTSTTGVTIVNGNSAYPNMPASSGSGANTTPFSFTLGPSLPADAKVNFTLAVNYSGGHQASQSWNFSIQVGHELITNGGFESGNLSGWNVSVVSTGGSGSPFAPWTVSPAGSGGYSAYQIVTTSPQAGIFDAWNGFDGGGPMEYRMYQDVTIPAGAMLNLIWKDRAQWNFCCGATVPRVYEVQLRDPSTNAVLTTLYSYSTGIVPGYHDTGWLVHGNSLAAYAGQTVRVFFLEQIPETFTGPGQIEFDSISLSNGPLPTPTPTPTPTPIPTATPTPSPTPTPGQATPGLYAGTKGAQLLTINVSTGAGTLVGTLPGLGSTEIEFNDSTRRAFTQFPDGTFQGQEFDISTGAGLGGPIADSGSFTGLEWVGSSLYGTMITASHGPSQLRILDPLTGTSTLVGSTGIVDPVAGLAYDQTAGVMYGITGGANGSTSSLVTLNLATGAATNIGSVGFNGGSLEFGPDGNLYAGSVGGTGNLYRINKVTGAGTLVGVTGFTNITGLTLVTGTSPSPTPTPTPTGTPTPTPSPTPAIGDVVISQVYSGGGNAGSTYQANYLELYNRTNAAINIAGWPIYVTSATGTFNVSVSFVSSSGVFIQPHRYLLIQIGTAGSNGAPLSPDRIVSSPLMVLSPSGKVFLARPGSSLFGNTCPPNSNILDYVGYGSDASCFEGTGPTPSISNTTAAVRKGGGCVDSNNNSSDFLASSPNPHNSSAPANSCANPIDDPEFFVRQHYLDFLNRQPDPSGLAFWINEITSCGADQACIELKRINVSAAFYLSIEFQQTGYLVERFYKAAYGNASGTSTLGGPHQLTVPIIRLSEFLPDTQTIGQGVIVNQPGWEIVLENNKQAFAAAFVQRARFTTAFSTSMTAAQFVDTLNTNAGNPLSQSERDQLVSDLATNAKTRAQVLRAVAEDPDLNNAEFNRAFVLMQYFGYLRRNPNDAPDSDYSGYNFWLNKLNSFNGSFQNAEMVKAFISSIEYRRRFGQ